VEVEELEDILAGLQVWVAEADSGVPYYEVDWSQPIGLVVGSEASGTQPSLRTLTGNRVHVPMPGGSESLNAAIAAAVMLFEIVRQREIL
jgi:TrmH family RNA methyltransferase